MKPIYSAAYNAEALVDLLENILGSYHDSDSRPVNSLMLYRLWLQLSTKYRVRFAKGLVVIEGGAKFKRRPRRRRRRWLTKTHLKLMPKVVPL
jgi:hypothetical protein